MKIEFAEIWGEAAANAGYLFFEDYPNRLVVPAAEPDDRGGAPVALTPDSSDPSVISTEEWLLNEVDAEEGILACWKKNASNEPDQDSGMPADEEVVMHADWGLLRRRSRDAS